ncbi:TetR/AcrR family transcriptional regulator [Luteimonas sp. Y-2-2-4F]|nr:TetR/AcrR family transcriptional regulator [Luteimonas sp. Y-2-2-4F]MCD9032472.1 TetR/AcrR family transcriptional regulator [Luteimonas sp. Y-2-2-4F]
MTHAPPQRQDAALRRERLLDAANAVFSEQGVTAPLELVIERAGLGRATLYRNFPDRAALIEALIDRGVDRIAERFARTGAQGADAFDALLEVLALHVAESAPLVDYWRAVDLRSPGVLATRRRLVALAEAPLAQARAAGRVRDDVAAADVPLILAMFGACLRGGSAAERRRLALRALALLRHGLAPAAP